MRKVGLLVLLALWITSGSATRGQDIPPVVNAPLYAWNTAPVSDIDWHPWQDILTVASQRQVQIYAQTGTLLDVAYVPNAYPLLTRWRPDGAVLATSGDQSVRFYSWSSNALSLIRTVAVTGTVVGLDWGGNNSAVLAVVVVESYPNSRAGRLAFINVDYNVTYSSETYIFNLSRERQSVANLIAWNGDTVVIPGYLAGLNDGGQRIVAEGPGLFFVSRITATQTSRILFSQFEQRLPISVSWQSTSKRIAVSLEGNLNAYTYPSGSNLGSLGLPFATGHRSIKWSPNGRYLAADEIITDENGVLLGSFQNLTDFDAIDWHPNGDRLATANNVEGIGNVRIEDATLIPGMTFSPIAKAGDNRVITRQVGATTTPVSLSSSGSYDPDGSIVSYTWRENNATVDTTANPTLNLTLGRHTIELVVTDNTGLVGRATVVIEIVNPTAPCPTLTERLAVFNNGAWTMQNVTPSPFTRGQSGDIPLLGDWDGNGTHTVGTFRPSTQQFHLFNGNSATGAAAPNTPFQFGVSSDVPLAGDWNADGTDTVGLYRPSTGEWFLLAQNSANSAVFRQFVYGLTNEFPVTGDWDGDGDDNPGVYRASSGQWLLRNTSTQGFADNTVTWNVGSLSSNTPIVGRWDAPSGGGPAGRVPQLGRFSGGTWTLRCAHPNGLANQFQERTLTFGGAGRPLVGGY